MFGNLSSIETIYINPTTLNCLAPSKQMKDRFYQNRTIKGYSTDFSVICPFSHQKSHNHLSLFVKYGT